MEYKLTYQALADTRNLDQLHWDNKRKVHNTCMLGFMQHPICIALGSNTFMSDIICDML